MNYETSLISARDDLDTDRRGSLSRSAKLPVCARGAGSGRSLHLRGGDGVLREPSLG